MMMARPGQVSDIWSRHWMLVTGLMLDSTAPHVGLVFYEFD